VGPRAGLDLSENRKSVGPAGNRTAILRSSSSLPVIAIVTEVYHEVRLLEKSNL
jgi:hypothetical protein